jgi:transposase
MGRKQNRESVWRGRMARFQKSGLTVQEFCRQEGVSTPTFYQWKKRLKERTQPAKRVQRSGRGSRAAAKMDPFVAIDIASAAMAEIEFPNGVRIRVPAANAEALRAALLAGSEVCQEVRPC